MEVITSNRGKPKLLFEGYSYVKDNKIYPDKAKESIDFFLTFLIVKFVLFYMLRLYGGVIERALIALAACMSMSMATF